MSSPFLCVKINETMGEVSGLVVTFAGHRPEKLPWGQDEQDLRCAALKIRLSQAVERYVERGGSVFLCGMARGCDFYFAEAVLALAQQNPAVRLEAYLPCPSQADRWLERDQTRWKALLSRCAAVYTVEPCYSDGCMLRRNRVMIERCDALLTVWDGSEGGTAAAVRYAQRLGKNVSGLWL